ncbi:GNAT family N-acetyltransferase [Hymenobacter metallicola]|uniref:GNAT family N-acetyltransferase n=1 Tax=Hymenobacter metallicola TaxID=2563114 RepID=A0A4Z0QEG6_9BACT|nr:GNAT family N-acetyltransferase [Hymenobacter metallicola]TGE28135.1 GNAT family N-acetyltransferase [Hymenobacter metallicola]
MLFSDLALARRLERTEAQANANFVEARQRLFPGSGANWIAVAGAYAMFDGVESPLTQSFGLGLFEAVGAAELTQIEQFFAGHGAPVYHEVSPLADAALLALLPTRGYVPIEYTNVLYRALSPEEAAPSLPTPQLRTRRIGPDEVPLWSQTSAAGWASESPGLEEFMRAYGQLSASSAGAAPFLAELQGQPIAAGGLFMHEGVALLMGASTVPAGRRQGAQSALLAARLHYAAQQGCTLAMMGALPGSQSQRNAEKNGFRVAYTRMKWQLMAETQPA